MRDPELRKLVRDIVTEVIETKKENEAASAAEQPVKRFGRLILREETSSRRKLSARGRRRRQLMPTEHLKSPRRPLRSTAASRRSQPT
jgi:hypothetical protein